MATTTGSLSATLTALRPANTAADLDASLENCSGSVIEDGGLHPVAKMRLRRLLELGQHRGRELLDADVRGCAVLDRLHLDVKLYVLLDDLVWQILFDARKRE
jgi:hypothetical protein